MKRLSLLLIVTVLSFLYPRGCSDVGFAAQKKQQDDRDQLRLRADLVQVRAVVTDKRGQPVGNLTKDDFEVLEDSRPQVISFFSAENLPAPPDSKALSNTA